MTETIQLRDLRGHRAVAVVVLAANASMVAVLVWGLANPGRAPGGVLYWTVLFAMPIFFASMSVPAFRSLRYGPGEVVLNSTNLRIHCQPVVDGEILVERSEIATIEARKDKSSLFGALVSVQALQGGVVGVSLRTPNVLIYLSETRRFGNVRRLTRMGRYQPFIRPLSPRTHYRGLWLCVDDIDAARLVGWFNETSSMMTPPGVAHCLDS